MRIVSAAGLLALAVACSPTAKAPSTDSVEAESDRLTAYLNAEFEEELAMSPQALTQLGRKEQYDKLDDYSDGSIDKKLAWRRESVAEMGKRFDPSRLDEEAKTSFDMWSLQLQFEEKAAAFRRQPYIFVKDGPHVFLPNFLITFHEVSEKARYGSLYLAPFGAGRALDQCVERAKLSASEGMRPPRFSYDQSIRESKNIITARPSIGLRIPRCWRMRKPRSRRCRTAARSTRRRRRPCWTTPRKR